MGDWTLNQANHITFVLVDSNGAEVAGLGTAFVLQLRKPGGAFVGSAGTKAEIGSGWYEYTSTANEANTPGSIAIKITHASTAQQNLEYTVQSRVIDAVEFTYTVDDGSDPIEGASIWISTDLAGNNVIWTGITDAFGVAKTLGGVKPFLDPGTYYFWIQKSGYSFTNPDTETVS